MDFSDALRAVKDGQHARRTLWAQMRTGWNGACLELVEVQAQDGREVMPLLMIRYPDGDQPLRPFPGANWDLLADDWEIV